MTHTFQMAFPDEISPWKCFYIDSNFTESRGVHLNESALVQVNRLLPNRHHAITWTKVNKDLSWHMTSLSHDELKNWFEFHWELRSLLEWVCLVSGNRLLPNQHNAITWTNVNKDHCCRIYRPPWVKWSIHLVTYISHHYHNDVFDVLT